MSFPDAGNMHLSSVHQTSPRSSAASHPLGLFELFLQLGLLLLHLRLPLLQLLQLDLVLLQLLQLGLVLRPLHLQRLQLLLQVLHLTAQRLLFLWCGDASLVKALLKKEQKGALVLHSFGVSISMQGNKNFIVPYMHLLHLWSALFKH